MGETREGLRRRILRFVDPLVEAHPEYSGEHKVELDSLEVFSHHLAQGDLFPTQARCANRISLGNFYETVALAIHGGVRYDSREFVDDHIRPDIINDQKKIVSEVKAIIWGSQLPLRDQQMNRMRRLQESNPDWEIRMMVFRHGFPNIGKYGGRGVELSEQEFYADLSRGPSWAFDIDFLAFEELIAQEQSTPFTYRYQAQNRRQKSASARRFEKCTCFRSQTMKSFFADPREVDSPFFVGRLARRYSTPEDLQLDYHVVAPIPITQIDVANRVARIQRRVESWQELYEKERAHGRVIAVDIAKEEAQKAKRGGRPFTDNQFESLVEKVYSRIVNEDGSVIGQIPKRVAA